MRIRYYFSTSEINYRVQGVYRIIIVTFKLLVSLSLVKERLLSILDDKIAYYSAQEYGARVGIVLIRYSLYFIEELTVRE